MYDLLDAPGQRWFEVKVIARGSLYVPLVHCYENHDGDQQWIVGYECVPQATWAGAFKIAIDGALEMAARELADRPPAAYQYGLVG